MTHDQARNSCVLTISQFLKFENRKKSNYLFSFFCCRKGPKQMMIDIYLNSSFVCIIQTVDAFMTALLNDRSDTWTLLSGLVHSLLILFVLNGYKNNLF